MSSDDRDDRPKPEESAEQHPHERAASELSDRAAESVGQRYDATKETAEQPHKREDDPEDG